MAFERKKFLGLTVVDFSASTGWNDSETSLTIKMAVDKDDNDVLDASKKLGEKIDFEMGGFKFVGFLDRLTERHDGGGVIYEAKVNDGKEILRNVECITKFYGTNNTEEDAPVDNLLNIFRYYEAQKFGNSQTDDTGMPYHIFQAGVNALSISKGIWSAGKKFSIKLDFSLPQYYRMPVPHVNLLDAISQVCDDLGLLYRIELIGSVFTIKTASLAVDPANQNVIGAIKTKANADENIISWETGTESANSVESNFLLWGGQKEQTLVFDDANDGGTHSAKIFWGYDRNGKPYWSSSSVYYEDSACLFFFSPGINYPSFRGSTISGTGVESIYFEIPIPGLEDIILSNGGLYYEINLIEAAIILGGNQDTWELYLEMALDAGVNDTYAQVYLRAARYNIRNASNFLFLGGTNENPVKRVFAGENDDVGIIRGTRVFAYLKSVLESALGKQFLWPIDSLGIKVSNADGHAPASKTSGLIIKHELESYISEDGLDPNGADGAPKKIYNIAPSDSGWSNPTTLKAKASGMPQEVFDGEILNQDGKTGNFVIIPTQGLPVIGADPKSCFYSGNDLWVRASLNPDYIYIDNKPYVLVTLSQAIFLFRSNSMNEVGYWPITNCFFGVKDRNSVFGQSLNVSTGGVPEAPTSFILNFKSTRNDFYGPWYVGTKGVGGKTKVEQDTNLVPWAFNSSSKLEEVAQKKLKDLTPISIFETGSYTRVGLPEFSLGQEMQAGGPKLTSISATYGTSGITTQHTFRTFTSKFGLPSRYMLERMKKTALKAYSDRKNILGLFNEAKRKKQSESLRSAGFGISSYFLDYIGRKNDRWSPHGHILMAQIPVQKNYAGRFGAVGGTNAEVKTLGITVKHLEASAAFRKQSSDGQIPSNKAGVSLDAIFSPYSNFADFYACSLTSKAYAPKVNFDDKTIATAISLNPFQLNSYIGSFMSDDSDRYCNWTANTAPQTLTKLNSLGGGKTGVIKSRAIALRGPLMISGWGQSLYYPKITVPDNDKGENHPGRTAEGYAGPLDLMWDDIRGVWTSHGTLIGRSLGMIKKNNFIPNDKVPLGSNSNDSFAIGSMRPAGLFGVVPYENSPQYNYFSGHDIPIVNLGKTIGSDQPIVAHLNQHTGEWWVEGQGCGIRYDVLECGSGSEDSEVIAAEALNKDFTITRDMNGDLAGCIIKNDDVKEFSCIDLLQTNGFTGNLVYLKTKEGETESLRFKNGLAKEIITTTAAPPTTTTAPGTTTTSNANTTTTTSAPGEYCVVETGVGTQCYNCSADCGAELVLQGPYPLAECESYLPGLNAGCSMTLVFDDPCFSCYYDANGEYTGPTKAEDCAADAEQQNANIPGCGCPPYYLNKYDDPSNCHYCSQSENNSIGTYEGCDALTNCEEARIEADLSYGEECTTTTTTECPDYYLNKYDDPSNCHYCSQAANNSIGTYTGCDALTNCEEARIEADLPYGEECTTTTTSTEPPCPTMYLHKNENDDCHYCSQSDQDAISSYNEFLIDGVCSTLCEDAKAELDAGNPDCQLCFNIVGDCSPPSCYSCEECPEGQDGQFSSKVPCDEEAARLNAACNPACVTTTTSTTSGPTTTTPDPNDCIDVVTAVHCAADGTTFTYDKVSVKRCTTLPAVQKMPDLEMLLLKAKVESLTDQLSRLYNILQLYGIDAMGDK